MTLDRTQQQGEDEQRRALELSLKRVRPPTDVPGYEPQRFLGAGAYGEVWVALDRNTGRRVAIKFYAHRGGLDWSLLSREVEKLVFLSADRYVVQLLDVGWDAEPPYYVMEYIEQGSLDDRLKKDGPMRVDDAVTLLREVAIGLLHAHGKGVLHCDLKPANVLLDQDSRPRLADFGQSRLSHEQTPALGTLFYMAPEQADLRAVPDARWDVYALGALLYCMLTGAPPHRHDRAVTEIERSKDLDDRLARYRKVILNSPPPNQHRQVQGVDRALAEIIDTSLAADPKRRYANVQAVLDALDARARRRARRPLVMLGAVAPALLLLVVSLVAWRLFNAFVAESNRTLTDRAIQSDQFAAQYVAKTTSNELEQRFHAVEQVAADPDFQKLVEAVENDPDLQPVLAQLSDPNQSEMELAPLRTRLIDSAPAQRLQARLAELLQTTQPAVASWFVNDNRGLSIARVPENTTVGSNFAWRSYYYGGLEDRPRTWRPGPEDQLQGPHLSVAYSSQATSNWVVSVSAPILKSDNTYLGIVALTVPVDRFIEFPGDEDQFAVLVDGRAGPNQGRILQHPLFAKLVKERGKLPDRLAEYKISPDEMPADHRSIQENFSDPLADDPSGKSYQRHWLAAQAPVVLRGKDTGWAVIVQEGYDAAIGHTLENLRHSLVSSGVLAFGLITIVVTLLWAFVIRMLNDNPARNGRRGAHKNGNGDSIATARSSQTPH